MGKITISAQDYLKAIYTLSKRHGRATTSQIAARLNVRPASVTSMLQKLSQSDPPLVIYRKHGGATLTGAGKQVALTVIRRHRLLEKYLCEKLGYGWDEVHEEAELLEHVVSAYMVDQIAAVLNEPTFNPHGQPIPSSDLVMPVVEGRPLTSLNVNDQATLKRVRDNDSDLLRYLTDHGLTLGVRICVQSIQPDGTLLISILGSNDKVPLTQTMAQQLYVNRATSKASIHALPN